MVIKCPNINISHNGNRILLAKNIIFFGNHFNLIRATRKFKLKGD